MRLALRILVVVALRKLLVGVFRLHRKTLIAHDRAYYKLPLEVRKEMLENVPKD